MTSSVTVTEWLESLELWANNSIHRRRLQRAFLGAPEALRGDPARLIHGFARLGTWADELASAAKRGEILGTEIADHLLKVAEFGELALNHWLSICRPTQSDQSDTEPSG